MVLEEYPLNTLVSVTITSVIDPGLLGHVNDIRALIRLREITWKASPDLNQFLGTTRTAVIIGHNMAYHQLELSLRLAERDPWHQITDKYQPGIEVQGKVVGLIGKAAFVELEPGVEGFLHISDFLSKSVENIENFVWIGDYMKVLVTDVNPKRRRLRLSLKELLIRREATFRRRLWKGYQPRAVSQEPIAALLPTSIRQQLLEIDRIDDHPIEVEPLDVLVIEDDEIYSNALSRFLKHNGCNVVWHADPSQALSAIHDRTTAFDLILIDWGLPVLRGHELVQLLCADKCPSRLAMVFEPAPLRERPDVWDVLLATGIDVFSKADGADCEEGILLLLRELRQQRQGVGKSRSPVFPSAITRAQSRPTSLHLTGLQGTALDKEPGLYRILSELKHDTQSTTVTLVRFDFDRRRALVEASAGQTMDFEDTSQDLIHSPLADILLKGKEVWQRVSPDSHNLQRLLAIISFEELLGIPSLSTESSSYGLMLFREHRGFNRNDLQKARRTAQVLAEKIQSRQLVRTLQPWQTQNLAGQIVSSAIHEVNNKLTSIRSDVATLQDGLKRIVRQPARANDTAFLNDLEQSIDNVAGATQEIERLRNYYLGLMASDDRQAVDLVGLIKETIQLLNPEAKHHNILLECEAPNDLPRIYARPSELRQVLLNVILNAIQQMSQIEREGIVMIEATCTSQANRIVQVRIRDEGIGIHTELWERIFNFGFTKRQHGSGLGLTVSRQIVESLGGILQVEESYILWGTTFLLELPVGA